MMTAQTKAAETTTVPPITSEPLSLLAKRKANEAEIKRLQEETKADELKLANEVLDAVSKEIKAAFESLSLVEGIEITFAEEVKKAVAYLYETILPKPAVTKIEGRGRHMALCMCPAHRDASNAKIEAAKTEAAKLASEAVSA
jgi:hypothetical protein